jgi:hypothetical protein
MHSMMHVCLVLGSSTQALPSLYTADMFTMAQQSLACKLLNVVASCVVGGHTFVKLFLLLLHCCYRRSGSLACWAPSQAHWSTQH